MAPESLPPRGRWHGVSCDGRSLFRRSYRKEECKLETQSFDWAMFWQAASAIATTAAVIVALWQTRYQNKKKLKIEFIENVTYLPSTGSGTITKNQYFSVDIANVGNRKVCIQRVGILEKKVILKNIFEQVKTTSSFVPNKPIIFFVKDSVGTNYFCKTKKTLQQYFTEYKISD